MPTQPSTPTSKSGITTSSTGERHIPSSTRADGSVRKEIRVRPGYRPPEDVEVYKNRTAEAWKNRGKGGVPGADPIEVKDGADSKNAKRREARKRAAERKKEEGGEDEEKTNGAAEGEGVASQSKPTEAPQDAALDPEEVKAKEAKKLAKKLRQARELKEKKEAGDKLLPEQFEKVIKITELMRQLEKLGFDSNGEKKVPAEEDAGEKSAE